MDGLALVLRWLHIIPAVIAGGATIFVRRSNSGSVSTLSLDQIVPLK